MHPPFELGQPVVVVLVRRVVVQDHVDFHCPATVLLALRPGSSENLMRFLRSVVLACICAVFETIRKTISAVF